MTHDETLQSQRRAEARISVDKIRKALTEVDINVGALSDVDDLKLAREACAAIDAEIVKLTEVVKALGN